MGAQTRRNAKRRTSLIQDAPHSDSEGRDAAAPGSDDGDDDAEYPSQQPTKKRKTGTIAKVQAETLRERLFGRDAGQANSEATCAPPARTHSVTYHRPLLLDSSLGPKGRASLLQWFDKVSSSRSMPWRKEWIDPEGFSDQSELRRALEKRAYEVWISEIMLQQTRVSTVIDYWNRWMDKWPTIQDLAAAGPDDVLAAWRGLGYYSRATRIHQAANHVVGHDRFKGLLPEDAKTLEAEVPGVGRYTAGAVSSIVFGRPEAMVDGNVLRVLSRQLGLLANVKTDKTTIDTLWAAADALAKQIARDPDDDQSAIEDIPKSDRPGRWGQALMELGSTVCTPKPNCAQCPISSTCRAYQEGQLLVEKKTGPRGGPSTDMEDICNLCEPLDQVEDSTENSEEPKVAAKEKPARQSTLAAFAFTRQSNGPANKTAAQASATHLETIVNYAKKFPVKVVKKAVREEETLVCVIRRGDGQILIHRRPEKGLLAGLWEFPSHILEDPEISSKQRKQAAMKFTSDLLGTGPALTHIGELGSLPWLFSHIKLTMHVHLFQVDDDDVKVPENKAKKPSRWSDDIDGESMGTGMRKCWHLAQNASIFSS